jgi:hypothetical protein
MAKQNCIALIFDFDDTLCGDSTTQFLEANGVDVDEFWGQTVKARVDEGGDPDLAWLNSVLGLWQDSGPLAGLKKADLKIFGSKLELFSGVEEMVEDLKAICRESKTKPQLVIYVVSGGLEEIVANSPINKFVNGVRACRLNWGADDQPSSVRNTIGFTTKTRCLYEINKGIFQESRSNPFLVNEVVPDEERAIPFENMIYVGDGLTDIPSFSLVRSKGGKAVGIFDPAKPRASDKAWKKLVRPRRVDIAGAPKYRADNTIGALLRTFVKEICLSLELS